LNASFRPPTINERGELFKSQIVTKLSRSWCLVLGCKEPAICKFLSTAGLLDPTPGCPLTPSLIKQQQMNEREYFVGGVKSGRQYVVSIKKPEPEEMRIPGEIRAKAAFIDFRGEKSSRAIELTKIEPDEFSKLNTKPVETFAGDAQIFEILS
jgi:hypothetical protein